MPFERGELDRNQIMSSKEELYSTLTEKIIRLNEELIRFSKQAEETQTVIAKASQVTTLYSKLYTILICFKCVDSKMPLLLTKCL